MSEATLPSPWDSATSPRGEVVARLRTALGLTQQQLADLMTQGGRKVNRVSVNRWEKGVFAPTDSDIDHISALYADNLARELITFKRAALTAASLPTDTPAFDRFVKQTQSRVWFITHVVVHGGKSVMRASHWCDLLNIELHVLNEVPAVEPVAGRSPLAREPWQMEAPGDMPTQDEHRPLTGFLVGAALEASSRGVPFTQVVQEYAPILEDAAKGWARRLEFEVRERLRWLRAYSSNPSLNAFERTVGQEREALRLELRNRRFFTRQTDGD